MLKKFGVVCTVLGMIALMVARAETPLKEVDETVKWFPLF